MERIRWEWGHIIRNFRKNPPLVILIPLGGLLFAFARQAVSIYLDMLPLLLSITLLSWLFTILVNGNFKILTYVLILLTIGTMLQCVFLEEKILGHPDKIYTNPALSLQVQYGMAFAAACLGGFFYRKCRKVSDMKWCRGYVIASILISVGTILLAVSIGGAKNWITIGGMSIQTTEIVKVLYLFIAAGLLGMEQPSRKRLLAFYIITLIDVFFLAVQSEFGTMLLILLIFFMYLFLFVPDIKVFLKVTIVFIIALAMAVTIGSILTKWKNAGSFLGTNPLSKFYLSNYDKIANRFIFWLDPYKDKNGLGYQLIQAKNSIVLGGLFGTTTVTKLPVETSDLVYPALIQRCGIVFALIVFLIFIFLWLEGILLLVKKKDRYHCAVASGIVFMLFFQALIIIGGSTGLCPLTGITLPFISSGGSSLMVSAFMIGVLIVISGNVSWEGMNTNEEAFFKKGKILTKCSISLRHFYAHSIGPHFSRHSGTRSGGGQDKGSSKKAKLSEVLHKRKHY